MNALAQLVVARLGGGGDGDGDRGWGRKRDGKVERPVFQLKNGNGREELNENPFRVTADYMFE